MKLCVHTSGVHSHRVRFFWRGAAPPLRRRLAATDGRPPPQDEAALNNLRAFQFVVKGELADKATLLDKVSGQQSSVRLPCV